MHKTTNAALTQSPARAEQKAKLDLLRKALQSACQAHHLDGSPGTTRGRKCACGKAMGHGKACEMLAIVRNFFRTADLDNPKSWEYALVEMLSEVIP
jgi:hypothetical protein